MADLNQSLYKLHYHGKVTFLYLQSPSLNLENLTVLDIFLSTLPSTMPAVIVGDFNENIFHKDNTKLLKYMDTCGYTQHVKQSTTDRGQVQVETCDIYYSDHDWVILVFHCKSSITRENVNEA